MSGKFKGLVIPELKKPQVQQVRFDDEQEKLCLRTSKKCGFLCEDCLFGFTNIQQFTEWFKKQGNNQ